MPWKQILILQEVLVSNRSMYVRPAGYEIHEAYLFFLIAICASELPSNKKSSSPQSIYQRTDFFVLSCVFLINSFTEYFENYFDTNVSLIAGLSLFRLFFVSSNVSGPQ